MGLIKGYFDTFCKLSSGKKTTPNFNFTLLFQKSKSHFLIPARLETMRFLQVGNRLPQMANYHQPVGVFFAFVVVIEAGQQG